jgi:hypothetical protein
MSQRYTERREFGPSIEWYELPIVGAPPRRRPWKAIAAVLSLAAGVACLAWLGW